MNHLLALALLMSSTTTLASAQCEEKLKYYGAVVRLLGSQPGYQETYKNLLYRGHFKVNGVGEAAAAVKSMEKNVSKIPGVLKAKTDDFKNECLQTTESSVSANCENMLEEYSFLNFFSGKTAATRLIINRSSQAKEFKGSVLPEIQLQTQYLNKVLKSIPKTLAEKEAELKICLK